MVSINQLSVETLFEAVRTGDRAMIGRAITLVESRNAKHQEKAQELLHKLLPFAGKAQRVGISGVPGVGKSTFIENLGCWLTGEGHKVAVLAVDPSSSRTGGSILGDKTRMDLLSADENAFIRPSPSAGVLGGVARATRETMVILEAAGYDTVLVETVGTGQSETMVADMVDFFLVLMLPGAGDELQGIKKGILELADMVAVNKADIFEQKLKQAMREYKSALHIMTDASPTWHPPVVACAGLTGTGVPELWARVEKHRKLMDASGERQQRREQQRLYWLKSQIQDRLLDSFYASEDVAGNWESIEAAVKDGKTTVSTATEKLLALYSSK
ncbi:MULTISPECIES: methylmalonyl Co-A mutase-associated GTPase MeaB [Kordiimonas]|uniref:methylmalonyl Co-A mutase-associated GTPase MeaB n=1 Tax=Kordiimonas TaxID=288021 RepID=UPI001FF1D1FD|nr:methylmalonyl Co-A mutase-associated GTPase MeaB [Kordiimonas sp. SCSIO 12603]MCK0070389.1 methylmalonyl Co-A mutase-associated GTPase MeaB [Kordiimonas laminariae]UTW57534.1 methylmalonyl Co-A mutase-associated GTPase MeaB [Kordiimonas sp. SCSIO 12603]